LGTRISGPGSNLAVDLEENNSFDREGVVFFKKKSYTEAVIPSEFLRETEHMHGMKTMAVFFFLIGLFTFGYHDVSAIAAVTDCPDGGTGYTLVNGVCIPSSSATGLSDTDPYTVIVSVMNWLMAMSGIVAILMFVVSGWMYLTAGGDEKKTETAKNNIKYTIIGLVVALTAFITVRLIANLLGASTTGVGTNI
jgi:hypothetical protein